MGGMIRIRVIAAAVLCLCLFAWQDVLIWQRIFEHNQVWSLGVYHDGWRITLDALPVAAVVFLWGRWLEIAFFAATLQLFARNGTSDILYNWLDGQAIPQQLPCLDSNSFILFKPVTGEALVLSSVA